MLILVRLLTFHVKLGLINEYLLLFSSNLQQAASCLSELDQSPPASTLESMQPFLNAIVKPELLKHQDRDVKLLVATCICEITRITAPEAPYSDDVLKVRYQSQLVKWYTALSCCECVLEFHFHDLTWLFHTSLQDIFHLIVGTFSGLKDTSGPSFGRRVVILETLAKYRSCVVMLDLECDDLVNEMFSTFFAVARFVLFLWNICSWFWGMSCFHSLIISSKTWDSL